MTAPLSHRIGDHADAARIAEALGEIWREIDAAMSPVIGQRGVAALYRRSLHLAATAHPFLRGRTDSVSPASDPAAWASLFAACDAAQAAACGSEVLQTFHTLLVSLIGPSLTERLLRSVWGPTAAGESSTTDNMPSSGPPAQDPPP